MRHLFFRTVVVFCLLSVGLNITCEAQYLERRKKYGQIEYTYQAGDPYQPFAAALGAVFLPGMGHLIAGEPRRALGFAAGFYGGATLGTIGLVNLLDEDFNRPNTSNLNNSQFKTLFVVGTITTLAFYFYGIFDAMEVAEINNLAYRFNQKGPYMQLRPGFNTFSGQAELHLRLQYVLSH